MENNFKKGINIIFYSKEIMFVWEADIHKVSDLLKALIFFLHVQGLEIIVSGF